MAIAIIVAGGQGKRFQSNIAKQYLPLAGKPVLSRTLDVFCSCDLIDRIVLVIPVRDADYCRDNILIHVEPNKPIEIVAGGVYRQESVLNGLEASGGKNDDIVLIHDGVRPFLTHALIRSCIAALESADGVTVAVPATDTLVSSDDEHIVECVVDRSSIWHVQTPQAFRYGEILDAHRKAAEQGLRFTDDASLMTRFGRKVRVVPGFLRNIKITRPEDMSLARAIARTFDIDAG